MGQRKARFAAAACMVSISLMLGACKSGVPADSAPKAAETGQEELKLVFWHYYNDAQKQYLDRLIKEYNETEGAGKHVVVEASSQGSIGDLTNKIDLALNGSTNDVEMANMSLAYRDMIVGIVNKHGERLVDAGDYLSEEDLAWYNQAYLDEGYIGGKLYILPLVKSTELLLMNQTRLDRFLDANPRYSADGMSDWDSLEQINLLTAMEKQFGVKFKLDDVRGLANVGDMVDLILRLAGLMRVLAFPLCSTGFRAGTAPVPFFYIPAHGAPDRRRNISMNSYTLADISPGLTADFTLEVTAEKMALFYELTGDCSPIHMDEAYAQRRGYPGRVVYGMLGASLFSTLAGVYLPGEHCLLHGVECKFARPVFIGDVLTVSGTVTEVNETFREITVKAVITNQNGQKVTRGVIRAGVAV